MSVAPSRFMSHLRRSGWRENRQVAVDGRVPSNHPAYQVLSELGGVSFASREWNKILLDFQYVEEAAEEARKWTQAYGMRLVGVAEIHNGHGEAYMTEQEHLIAFSLIHDACWFLGANLEAAMDALWREERARPMLLPGQESVDLYGETIMGKDPRVILPGTELLS